MWCVFVCVLGVSDRLHLQSRARARCIRANTEAETERGTGNGQRGVRGGEEERPARKRAYTDTWKGRQKDARPQLELPHALSLSLSFEERQRESERERVRERVSERERERERARERERRETKG